MKFEFFQASSEVFYEIKYYLSVDEARQDKYSTSEFKPKVKRPRISSDYQDYENLLASSKSIAQTKHLQAIQEEKIAALAILDAPDDDTITMQFDKTSRRRIKGEDGLL